MENSHRFFRNIDCRYFPCHEVSDETSFNCMFCFCPLYLMKDCGGRFKMTDKGIKNCTDCKIPHRPEGYDYIIKKIKEANAK